LTIAFLLTGIAAGFSQDAVSNKKLSDSRAKSVMDALDARGIDKTRMSAKGWGQENPVADNRTEDYLPTFSFRPCFLFLISRAGFQP
jgi:outer membrane protein OmpA-like peptidoglycan-associated protein